jgi:hypothetical protein
VKLLVAILSLAAAVISKAQADDADMAKAAAGFYAVAHASGSGLPDTAARAKLAPWLTPHLASLIDKASVSEAGFTAANKNAPPLIEGDLYSSLFEGPTAFAIGTCSGDAKTGHCTVNLTYDDKSRGGPTHWSDTLYLANTGDGWKVDDIGYGGTWDFGNKGRLSETLKQVADFVSK